MKFENFDNYEIPMNQRHKKHCYLCLCYEGLDEFKTFLDDSRDMLYIRL